ncbi:hypothetical protein AAG570_006884 [Ranatra chinensis]|uniref:Uncharacterized protein n=1 Tax=Ranatra chinensis TaxID=642074 RepID=A0ABD0YVD4_9HEMI
MNECVVQARLELYGGGEGPPRPPPFDRILPVPFLYIIILEDRRKDRRQCNLFERLARPSIDNTSPDARSGMHSFTHWPPETRRAATAPPEKYNSRQCAPLACTTLNSFLTAPDNSSAYTTICRDIIVVGHYGVHETPDVGRPPATRPTPPRPAPPRHYPPGSPRRSTPGPFYYYYNRKEQPPPLAHSSRPAPSRTPTPSLTSLTSAVHSRYSKDSDGRIVSRDAHPLTSVLQSHPTVSSAHPRPSFGSLTAI